MLDKEFEPSEDEDEEEYESENGSHATKENPTFECCIPDCYLVDLYDQVDDEHLYCSSCFYNEDNNIDEINRGHKACI
mgnify:CR=1 FL=1